MVKMVLWKGVETHQWFAVWP